MLQLFCFRIQQQIKQKSVDCARVYVPLQPAIQNYIQLSYQNIMSGKKCSRIQKGIYDRVQEYLDPTQGHNSAPQCHYCKFNKQFVILQTDIFLEGNFNVKTMYEIGFIESRNQCTIYVLKLRFLETTQKKQDIISLPFKLIDFPRLIFQPQKTPQFPIEIDKQTRFHHLAISLLYALPILLSNISQLIFNKMQAQLSPKTNSTDPHKLSDQELIEKINQNFNGWLNAAVQLQLLYKSHNVPIDTLPLASNLKQSKEEEK